MQYTLDMLSRKEHTYTHKKKGNGKFSRKQNHKKAQMEPQNVEKYS